jgi:hypothetical protein
VLINYKTFNDFLKNDGINHNFKIETPSSTHSNFAYNISNTFTGALYFCYDDKFAIAFCLTPPELNTEKVIAFGITWKRIEKYLKENDIEIENEILFYEKNKELSKYTLDIQDLFKKWVISYFSKA